MIELDFRTIYFSYFLTDIVCLIVMIAMWYQSRKRYKGIDYIIFDYLFQVICLLLIFLRGNISDFLSMDVSNTLAVTGLLLGLIGLEHFTEKKSNQIHNYVFIVLFFGVQCYFTFIKPDLSLRILNSAVGYLFISSQCAWLLLKRVPKSLKKITFNVGWVFILFSILNLIRIADFFTNNFTTDDYFKVGNFNLTMIISFQLLFILLTFSLVLMINRRLFYEITLQEEKFSKAFHSVPYAILISRLTDGKIIEVNDGFYKMTHYNKEDINENTIVGLNIWVNNEDRDWLIDKVGNNQKVVEKEFRFRRKNGDILIGLITSELIVINNEKCLLSVVNDITERKQAEEKFRMLFELSPIGLAMVDNSSGEFLEVNTSILKATGYTKEEFLNLSYWDITPKKYEAQELKQLQDLDETGYFGPNEKEYIRKDGTRYPLSISGALYSDSTGKQVVWGIIEDISERKLIEQALIESEKRFRLLYENAPLAYQSLNAEGCLIDVNPKWLDTMGYQREEVIGRYFGEFMTPESAELIKTRFPLFLAEGKIEPSEFEMLRKDGSSLIVSYDGKIGYDELGQFKQTHCIFTDITASKRAEEELIKSKEQLKKFATYLQNKQEEEKVLLATQLDNELGQNLVAMKMDIGLLKNKILKENNNKESEEIFNKLDQTYNTIGNSISTTLKFMDNLRYEVLYLMGFVEAVKLYSAEFQEKNNISCEFESTITKLDLETKHATSLFRIVENTMTNIAQHSKATKAKISLSINNNKLMLEIWDNGIGFNPDKLKNENPTGLIYMKERVNLMGGELFIISILNNGTSVRVEIPYAE